MSTDRQVLVLMAHADDETLGCGGTIPKLLARGWRVEVVILADGIITTRTSEQDNRPHTTKALSILGLGKPHFLGFPDQRFDTVPMADLVNAVAQLDIQPDLIFTHVDTDLNLDHRLVCEVAKVIGRPRRKPVAILGCEIPNTSFWNGTAFPANYFVDISTTIEKKIEAFSCYLNEVQPFPNAWSREGLRLIAQYHGMQVGYGFAEAFNVIRGFEVLMP